ncbi:MAG: hypothetical protein ACE37N_07185, partial [Pseudohongiellaceae bacterium]
DAPDGPRGISLFLVPKMVVGEDGELTGANNNVRCGSIEHKMGIKGSATCVMNFDGARGYLVGKENNGLANMFTMMNYERLSMGLQGNGHADSSYQVASAYAKPGQATRQTSECEQLPSVIVHRRAAHAADHSRQCHGRPRVVTVCRATA